MTNEQLITFIAEKLQEGEKPERVAKMIRGLSADQAKDLVQTVHRAMKWNVRKQAFWKMLGSAVLLAVFGGIFLATGRLFFIILPIAAAGFLWGAVQFIFALGYDAD